MTRIMRYRQAIIISILFIFISGCASTKKYGASVFTIDPGSETPVETEFEIPKPTDYRIGLDDLIEVNIWRHPDLTKEVIVRPDGKISYLLIGDLQAAGLTVTELDDVITKKFEEYAKGLAEKEVAESPVVRKEYRIGLGDGLDISVWKVPDLTARVIVRPDGKISYPLTGDVDAHGKTLTELDNELTEKLSKYVKDPQVSVMITTFGEVERRRITFVTEFITTFLEERPEISIIIKGFGSRKVIVLGQVNGPGIYDIKGSARLLDAIAYAGGFTKTAVEDNVFLIRGEISSNPTVVKVNIWDIIKRGTMALNLPLQNQDIIYAPNSIVGNVNIFIEQIQPTLDVLSSSVTLKDAMKKSFKLD